MRSASGAEARSAVILRSNRMPPSLTASRAKKLRERLVASGPVEQADLRMLSQHQAEFGPALERALAMVEGVRPVLAAKVVQVTHRVKTHSTLIDKLEKGSGLLKIQDVVGIRVVAHMR
jgi:hypothetical protein